MSGRIQCWKMVTSTSKMIQKVFGSIVKFYLILMTGDFVFNISTQWPLAWPDRRNFIVFIFEPKELECYITAYTAES